MYMAHVCFYVCCSDVCVCVCGYVCCVAVVVKYSVFLYIYVRGVMDVVFSVFVVTRAAVGARVWEV